MGHPAASAGAGRGAVGDCLAGTPGRVRAAGRPGRGPDGGAGARAGPTRSAPRRAVRAGDELAMADLQQRVVAFLEGRRTAELADLIQRHNGVPLAAPCLREVHTPESPVLQQSIERVLASELAVAIFLTGVGTTTVFDATEHMRRASDLRAQLDRATVAVRGPKPAAVL